MNGSGGYGLGESDRFEHKRGTWGVGDQRGCWGGQYAGVSGATGGCGNMMIWMIVKRSFCFGRRGAEVE